MSGEDEKQNEIDRLLDVGVSASATLEEAQSAFRHLVVAERSAQIVRKMSRLAIGRIILDWAARTGSSWEEAISELDPSSGFSVNLSLKSLMKYPRIVSAGFSKGILTNGHITITHLEEVTSCSGPEDPSKLIHWKSDCAQLLATVIEKEGMTKSEIRQRMRDLQRKHEVEPKRSPGAGGLMADYIQLVRVLLLPSPGREEFLREHGLYKKDLRERMIAIEAQLIERELIPANPEEHPVPKLK